MPIKIVEMKPDASVVKQVVCRNCGVQLEYVPNDAVEKKHTDYTGDTEVYRVIVCPKCNNDVEVK